ncbi:MAG: cyanophycin synthetase [Patescibacteria group bacterium]
MNKLDRPLLGKILQKIAPKIGATVIMEPKWNIVGQIIFRNGRKRYFKYSSLDINTLGASEIAKDKDYANFFMKRMGYPTIPGKTFFSDFWCKIVGSRQNIDAGYRYAKRIGFPVFIKPNSGSQGNGVSRAHNKREFYQAMQFVFTQDKIALVQKPVAGKDYRVVVLDDKIISAYERIPLNVIGDGVSSIRQLLQSKQTQFVASGRDTKIKNDDFRITQKLKQQGLNLSSAVKPNQRIFLLDNANLSSGGDSLDVTQHIHPAFKKIAVDLTKDMGLRLCGVDFIINGDITARPDEYWILEVNSAPGLDHYAKTGKEQEKIVEDMYLEILKAME